jgi:hypothetical protein
MATHPQTWVKVNVPVDSGISRLVSVLSLFPSLETIESCEGLEGQGAWVCFRYGAYWEHPYRDLAEFVLGYMAPRLVGKVGDDANLRIQTKPSGNIFGELSVRPEAISNVEMALRELARDFSVYRRHSSGYCGDTSGTSPERC